MRWLILPLPSGKPWNGGTIYKEALGGSESATAYLALHLHRIGEEVHVVTHFRSQDAVTYEGVKYYPQHFMGQLMLEHWDVVLASRWVEVLQQPWKTPRRLFLTHDMNPGNTASINAHKVVCLSRFQNTSWNFIESALGIIGNGVDLALFDRINVERNPNKLIWTSNPDRGLALAAKIFQEIRKRWPDLELHVYGRAAVYGWDASAEAPYLPLLEHRENVYLHEPLPKAGLARELKSAWAWFYPTFWPETYCIAALEAQAAGTPCITVPYGALNETVKGGILSYDFLNAVSQLRNARRWQKLSESGYEWASQNTWSQVAQRWLELAHAVS